MKGININCKENPFVEWILDGYKTMETRSSKSLHHLIGQRVGLVETGNGRAMLKGYATIISAIEMDSLYKWSYYHKEHVVPPCSTYDYNGKTKYGYRLVNVRRIEPVPVYTNDGRATRTI